jgi:hypothetical protein
MLFLLDGNLLAQGVSELSQITVRISTRFWPSGRVALRAVTTSSSLRFEDCSIGWWFTKYCLNRRCDVKLGESPRRPFVFSLDQARRLL